MQTEIAIRETTKLIADLLQEQMGLEDDVVAIYNQKRVLKPKSGLYLDVAIIGNKVYAATSAPVNDPAQPDLVEVQTVAMQEIVQIDIFSANAEARLRKAEVIMALTGIGAQQSMERHAYAIARIPPSFVDVSEVEGSARLNRYALTFNVLRAYSKARTAPTFTEFQSTREFLVNP